MIETIVVTATERDQRERLRLQPDAWLDKPKYTTIIAAVSEIAMRHRAAAIASSLESLPFIMEGRLYREGHPTAQACAVGTPRDQGSRHMQVKSV